MQISQFELQLKTKVRCQGQCHKLHSRLNAYLLMTCNVKLPACTDGMNNDTPIAQEMKHL